MPAWPAVLLQSLLDLVFPPRCEVCGTLGREAFCAGCRAQVLPLDEPYCRLCGHLFALTEARQTLCPQCREKQPHFDGARSACLHVGTVRTAILNLKFENCRRLEQPLAELLAERFRRETGEPGGLPWGGLDYLVPVPLHPSRRSWRGFDQALHLCRGLSRLVDLPVMDNVLRRIRPTTPQIHLTPTQRRQNVRRAFAAFGEGFAGRNLLLIDDVYTTGATANEAARAAREGGARSVYVLTISRPPPPWHPASFAMEPGDA